MTCIIIKQPHPLDAIWEQAVEAVSNAHHAMIDLGDDFTNAQLDAAGDVTTAAIQVVMALPARNLSDCLFKLDCAGIDDGHIRVDCDARAIIAEATALLDAGHHRGVKLLFDCPGLLLGVDL